ncbi:MAG: DJ-1/PfpI family protein [Methanosarcinaceae archaeon]|nr:DJ-1/PfpI family protein [Methanosarcinaceae archaeon]
MKKYILMVIAPENFRDEEFFEPKEVFEQNGFEVIVASTETGTAKGTQGGTFDIDFTVDRAKSERYDAIVISGGGGSRKHLWDNKTLHKLLNDFNSENKTVAAICISPVVLAKAGLLKEKKCTVFNDTESIEIIKKAGGKLDIEKNVVRDGNIITANGPAASKAFGEEVIKKL